MFADQSDGGRHFFRYLHVDGDVVYVGAMEHIYRLNADNISQTDRQYLKSKPLPPRQADKELCDPKQENSDFECRNHIRSMVLYNNQIHACGTGAYFPMYFTLNSNLEPVDVFPPKDRNTGIMRCPYGPGDSYVSLDVERGNPGSIQATYSGTILRAYQTDYVIYRPPLYRGSTRVFTEVKTDSRNDHWLNEVTFIAAFESQEYVFFFFKEIGLELESCRGGERKVISRVARICKSDMGGSRNILEKEWTTFTKARLNCSLNGEDYFDDLQDIKKEGDRYFATFWRSHGYANGTAVCIYQEADINDAFEGSFKEYEDGDWSEVPDNRVPSPRPGACSNDSRRLPSDTQYFIKSHPLMMDVVQQQTAKPLYHANNVFYSKLVVHKVFSHSNNMYYLLFMVTGNTIHKLVIRGDISSANSKMVAKWKISDKPNFEIRSIVYSNGYLYITTDEEVLQINTELCDQYYTCTDCVQDPQCGWNQLSQKCENFRTGLFQDVFAHPMDVCKTTGSCYDGPQSIAVKVPGDPLHLVCESRFCIPQDPIVWYYKGRSSERMITIDDRKYILSERNGLIVMSANQTDEGQYICVSNGTWLAAYNITVPGCQHDDPECLWQEEFRNWCNAFSSYKEEFNNWLCVKNECFSSTECPKATVPKCSLHP